jgi:drug/metabolite transporter (DMT)-like permease
VLLLGETLSLAIVGGGLLTLIGVGIIVIRRPQVAGPETERI